MKQRCTLHIYTYPILETHVLMLMELLLIRYESGAECALLHYVPAGTVLVSIYCYRHCGL